MSFLPDNAETIKKNLEKSISENFLLFQEFDSIYKRIENLKPKYKNNAVELFNDNPDLFNSLKESFEKLTDRMQNDYNYYYSQKNAPAIGEEKK